MFYSVRGKIICNENNFVVLDCGGVGYRCYTSQTTQNKLPSIGTEVMLYTHLVVREDAMELYGFLTQKELQCFELLITVGGVGSKMAISVLSVLDAENFVKAIATSNIVAISKAQGVGKKKAERIILELKDKIKAFDNLLPSSDINDYDVKVNISSDNTAKATEALTVLGYTPAEVTPILKQMDNTQPVEKLISGVLREMGRR